MRLKGANAMHCLIRWGAACVVVCGGAWACGDKIGLDREFIRVAIRTEPENKIVFAALKDVLS